MLSGVKVGAAGGSCTLSAWPGRGRPIPKEPPYYKELAPVWGRMRRPAGSPAKRREQMRIDKFTPDSDSYRG